MKLHAAPINIELINFLRKEAANHPEPDFILRFVKLQVCAGVRPKHSPLDNPYRSMHLTPWEKLAEYTIEARDGLDGNGKPQSRGIGSDYERRLWELAQKHASAFLNEAREILLDELKKAETPK